MYSRTGRFSQFSMSDGEVEWWHKHFTSLLLLLVRSLIMLAIPLTSCVSCNYLLGKRIPTRANTDALWQEHTLTRVSPCNLHSDRKRTIERSTSEANSQACVAILSAYVTLEFAVMRSCEGIDYLPLPLVYVVLPPAGVRGWYAFQSGCSS